MDGDWIIVSLGGSMISQKSGLDTTFLKDFRTLARALITEGHRLVVITGGGQTCRDYQNAAKAVSPHLTREDLDWIGIRVTQLNAHLFRLVMDEDKPFAIGDPHNDPIDPHARLIIGAGWEPGWSTDYDTALLAKRLGAKRIVNVSNVAYIYSEDPRQNPNAKRFEAMSWGELRAIVGDEWRAGMNVPFDPIAAKLCQEQQIEVAIVSGDDMENIGHALRGELFRGTRIR